MITEQLKQKLGNFLGKNTDNIVDNGQTSEGQQVCDLDTEFVILLKVGTD